MTANVLRSRAAEPMRSAEDHSVLVDVLEASPSWMTSMVVHLVVLLILAMFSQRQSMPSLHPELVFSRRPVPEDELPPPAVAIDPTPDVPAIPSETIPAAADEPPPLDAPWEPGNEGPRIDLVSIAWGVPDGDDVLTRIPNGDHGIGDRKEQFDRRDNTPEGKAVVRALRWLADHQLPDGGWSFDHGQAPTCRGRCRDAGSLREARIAATGLALLPFLGAGQTHRQGAHQRTVERGLYFLASRMQVGPRGGSLHEPGGRMYSHGIASIVLCEAHAMSRDPSLRAPAQAAVAYICDAQDPIGGGWRYDPRQRGDTSVVGWQLMALKSAHLSYMPVPQATVRRAAAFLDGVQYESGSRYGYTDAGAGSTATTAIGLLCRMYLGWGKDNPALMRGVEWLGHQGPSKTDMYYNYYATQVMFHWQGEPWRAWDDVMKAQLVAGQATQGHETGSWHFTHHHGDRGGRLYSTAMAALTLEVYYRVLSFYEQQSVEDDFRI